MRKTLIILSVLLMFITLTSTLFSFETSADGTVTDLTGTKWQMNSTISVSSICITNGWYDYNITSSLVSGSYSCSGNMWSLCREYGASSSRNFVISGESYPQICYSRQHQNKWCWQRSCGLDDYIYISLPPILTITGGTDATNATLIRWLTNNATQIIDGYDVSFNSMGGSSVATITNVTGINLTDEDGYYLSQYIPTKSGYKFDGWYTDTNYTNLIKEIFILTSDITLYAKWVPIFIYFDMNGGEGVGYWDGSDIGVYIYDGGTLELTDEEGNYFTEFTPYKEGWLFQGWYSDSEFTTLVTYVNTNDDITLYAKWTKEILIELNLQSLPKYTLLIGSIDEESITYIAGSSSIVRYLTGDFYISEDVDEYTKYITFYAVTAGAVEIRFNDDDGNEFSIVVYVSEYGTTFNYYKTLYIGSKYEITSGLENVDLSSMTYVGGDDTYCYVSSPYAGIPLNDEEIPEGDYIYFYGLKKGFCIINFNGKEDYPPVTFYFTILGTGEISLETSMDEMDLYIPPIEEQRGWDNLQKQLEDGFYENFINLDAFEIPGELNGFIENFNVWVNPLYTNGFVVAALTLVGIIAFAAYLVTAKTRG